MRGVKHAVEAARDEAVISRFRGASVQMRALMPSVAARGCNAHACRRGMLRAERCGEVPKLTVCDLCGCIQACLLRHEERSGGPVQEGICLRPIIRLWHRVRQLL